MTGLTQINFDMALSSSPMAGVYVSVRILEQNNATSKYLDYGL